MIDQAMGHGNSFGLHIVITAVVEIADLFWSVNKEEIGFSLQKRKQWRKILAEVWITIIEVGYFSGIGHGEDNCEGDENFLFLK